MAIMSPTASDQQPTLLDRFLAAVEEGGYHIAYAKPDRAKVECPHHGDRIASLSVTDKGDILLINCFANCEPGDVLADLGLTFDDLYAGKRSGGARRAAATYRQRKRERALRILDRMASDAERQQAMEADPSYWLRRHDELQLVGTPWADEAARACMRRAMIEAGFPWDFSW